MTQADVIDQRVFDGLMESIGGDREFLWELVEVYFDDSPKLFETLHNALDTGDGEAFRRAAHSLKSTSANFGAMVFSSMCKELEDLGKAGVLDGAEARVLAAQEEYTRVHAALQSLGAA